MRRWFVLILGLVILLSACGQKYDKDGTVWTSLYKKNETTDKYVKVEDMNEKEYQSNHKPVYEENNMKK
ncbi:TPA: hypothetical protein I2T10_000921 [Staphylococcus aureus]|nr:hypothetical protein [Staphylococcus aureus]